jgi:Ca-activated chloride channel family protein
VLIIYSPLKFTVMKKQQTFDLCPRQPIVQNGEKRLYWLAPFLLFLFYASIACYSQTGSIAGKVTDENGDGIIGASVIVLDSNQKLTSIAAATDFDGKYEIKNLKSGKYDLLFNYIGYSRKIMNGVLVTPLHTTILNEKLIPSSLNLMSEVMIVSYKKPLIDKGCTSIAYSTSSAAGVYQMNASKGLSIRGSRSIASQNVVNAIRMDQAAMPRDNTRVEHPKSDKLTNEAYNTILENEFLTPNRFPLSTFSIDVDAASYSIVRRKLQSDDELPKDGIRIEEMINYFPYEYQDATAEKPFSVQTEMSTCPWDSSHQLLKIGIQGKKIETKNLPPSNLVFLIDVSGSMSSEDKLPLVQKSLSMLVDQLSQQDNIAIVVYAGNAGLVLPSTSAAHKQVIKNAIQNLRAGGSTAGGAGIELAYKIAISNFKKEGNNRVLLCTDGDFNVGVSSDDALVKLIEEKRKSGVFLSVFGFGMGNYKDSKMEQLADKGNGNYAYIDNEKEAKKNMVTQLGSNFTTIAKDVKIQAVFNPAAVKSYRLIGYENRKLRNEDFSNDKIDAGEIGAGTCVTALYEIVLGKQRESSEVNLADKKKKTDMMHLSSDDLMALRIRFKKPSEDKSSLIETHIGFDAKPLLQTSRDFRFAASVAVFGMLLRQSKFSGNFDFDKTYKLAESGIGEDTEGYRREMLDLVKLAKENTKLATK